MKRVKLKNITNIDRFFQTVESCDGNVKLVGEGLELDLKSKLAQYFSLAKCFSGGEIGELELLIEKDEDMQKLLQFAIG
ncbi:MAG: polya polymerase [Lachnospiraceae bacterium]|nr:polya polymerase [Lachnospiraceae bacterium]